MLHGQKAITIASVSVKEREAETGIKTGLKQKTPIPMDFLRKSVRKKEGTSIKEGKGISIMIKRKFSMTMAIAVLSAFSAFTALAGWQHGEGGNQNRWWYSYDQSSYAKDGWSWLDGNGDGVAECYYFDQDGWLLTSTTTPDGYQVNEDGAWVVDGKVQTKKVAVKKNGVRSDYKAVNKTDSTGLAPKKGETNASDFRSEMDKKTKEMEKESVTNTEDKDSEDSGDGKSSDKGSGTPGQKNVLPDSMVE